MNKQLHGSYQQLIRHRPFMAFIVTQFFGAFNDNFYKIVVQLLALTLLTVESDKNTALSIASIVFVLPPLLFSGYAGFCADRFSKRKVIIFSKAFEIMAMLLAAIALGLQSTSFMLIVLFIMSTQSAFFSPAKYGLIPEIFIEEDLSRANAVLEFSTFLAIITGSLLGSLMLYLAAKQLGVISLLLVTIAVVGFLTSLAVPRVSASGAQHPFPKNPWAEIIKGTKRLAADRMLLLTVLGISYFFGAGIVIQQNSLLLAKNILQFSYLGTGLLMVVLAVGIGVGSLVAGWISGNKIELGLIPLGALGIAVMECVIGVVTPTPVEVATSLLLLAFFAGLFIVPLHALLQDLPEPHEKGRMIATNNFFNYAIMLFMVGWLWLSLNGFKMSPQHIFIALSVVTFAVTFWAIFLLPAFFTRLVIWLFTQLLFKVEIVGRPHIPHKGAALLIANHVSYADGLIIGSALPRFIRYMIYHTYYHMKPLHWFFKLAKAIPIEGGNPKRIQASLNQARLELERGHVVCIFAEGRLTRTGNLLPFRSGYLQIVKDLDVPIIPIHLDRLWNTPFAKNEHGKWWHWLRFFRVPVTISFGEAMPATATPFEVRQQVMTLGSDALQATHHRDDILALELLRSVKRRPFSFCMKDMQQSMHCSDFMVAALNLCAIFKKQFASEQRVGVLCTPSVQGALINIGLLLADKVVVNCPAHAPIQTLLEQCQCQSVITTRAMCDDLKLAWHECFIDLDQLPKGWQWQRRLKMKIALYTLPASLILRWWGQPRHAEDPAFIQFSRYNDQRGVVLSDRNVLANILGLTQVLPLRPRDRVVSVIPFYAAYGLTNTLLMPLVMGYGILFYDTDRHDIKDFGWFIAKNRAAILFDTLAGYQRYVPALRPDYFSDLRYAIVAGDPVPESFLLAFREHFGFDLLEGYGCTEMGPNISVNVPDVRSEGQLQRGHKLGSIGHAIPGVAVQVVDAKTHQPVPANEVGLLAVKGGGLFLGYLTEQRFEATQCIDGWWITSDQVKMDEEGFLYYVKSSAVV